MELKNAKAHRSLFCRVLILMLLVSAAAALLIWRSLSGLEQGMLEVFATQQDAYVQLVLDQIELQQGRSDNDIITDILSTLDASSSKYWVFSQGDSMLFVKDVVETNKYKGFTTATYYDSPSAKEFLDSLPLGRIQHNSIRISQKSYIASGSRFTYGDQEYRLCLLTNYNMLLENNSYLRVKSELWALALVVLVLLISIPAILAWKLDKLRTKQKQCNDKMAGLRRSLTSMNERFANRDWYGPANSLWQNQALPVFAQRLTQRGFSCATIAHLHFNSQEERLHFLNTAALTLPKAALRFSGAGYGLVLLFINQDKQTVLNTAEPLLKQYAMPENALTEIHTPQQLTASIAQLCAQAQEEQACQ